MFEHASNFEISGGTFVVGNITNYHVMCKLNFRSNKNDQLILNSVEANDKETKIHDWLKAPDCSVNFQTALDKKTEGTGQWIIDHSTYQEWQKSSTVLWIQGQGSG